MMALLLIVCLLFTWTGHSWSQSILEDKATASKFVNVQELDPTIELDIRYATTNNFTNKQMYDCGKCYLREEVAEKMVLANKEFREMGYRIKVFDCYRPQSVQYKLWQEVPNPQYVANPDKGSVHNRGGAVDLTLIDKNGKELPMGTGYDFFGEQAHQDYFQLPENILENRKLLKETLHKFGFTPIRTEWWHYDFYNNKSYPISDLQWDCN
ncbi:D-alanyl-D-alanine dipeptidase [Membranihabitans maritimus]|uniref:D-alanyl-D-alanine dipeptidase n=1 Tax=Membranihabitans maritimus TaxID=2904244 RepID=UPI001F031E3B|nr:D-alanyl-D-alanine dipeptidase [Membranihabitans maritimus]